jgi:hypothetical protein
VLILFSLTLFLSAFLLFWVQLMTAKMILPLLGGAPAVWNTCVLFFQAILLLGYAYADQVTRRLGQRQQILLHGSVLLLPLAGLPITLTRLGVPPQEANPIPWLLLLLLVAVGLPVFVVTTTAPLGQQWFAQTQHPQQDDPYFLYAASNLGSLLGLLSYPILIEPYLSLSLQSWAWAIAYGILILLMWGCGFFLWRFPAVPNAPLNLDPINLDPSNEVAGIPAPSTQQKLRWVILAFIPSSLLLGVTTYITTDIAAIPLLWALPLALYLLTFIVAFAGQLVNKLDIADPSANSPSMLLQVTSSSALQGLLPLIMTPSIMLLQLKVTHPTVLLLLLHLLGFGLAALVFHTQLARSRPQSRFLTSFYLWIAVGGVLAGVFNAIAAPLIFKSVLEYPLMLLLGLFLLKPLESASTPALNQQQSTRFWQRLPLRLTLPLCLGVLWGALLIGFSGQNWVQNTPGVLLTFGLLAAIAYGFSLRPLQVGLCCIFIFMLSQFSLSSLGGVLATERSFFGVYQVLQDQETGFNTLLHGTTVHGRQSLALNRRQEPLTYFTRSGPMGQLFTALDADCQPPQFLSGTEDYDSTPLLNCSRLSQVAVLGLGVGTLASYARPGQQWIFYEIDPLVVQIAQNPTYFSFLQQAPVEAKLAIGDARLQLAQAPDRSYDLIVMDAFSSDAIPVHLITQQAMQLYLQKLAPHGLLAINITNRYLDLEGVLSALARDLGLVTLRQYDRDISEQELAEGKSASRWVLMARDTNDFGSLAQDQRWRSLPAPVSGSLWTDDFSNLLQVIRRD